MTNLQDYLNDIILITYFCCHNKKHVSTYPEDALKSETG